METFSQKSKKGIVYFIGFIMSFFCVFSQNENLIPNYSFEEYNNCPGDGGLKSLVSNLADCKNWINPTGASPDYFNSCATQAYYSVPKHYDGNQYPYSGNAYVGIGFFIATGHYEYIQIKLKNNLLKDRMYCFSVHVNLDDNEEYCTNQIHYVLTKKRTSSKKKKILKADTFKKLIYSDFIQDKNNWLCLSSKYIAKGDENYLTIGLFDENVPFKYIGKNKNKSKNKVFKEQIYQIYFLIDDVSLVEIKDSSECKCLESIIIKNDSVKVKLDTVKSVSKYDKALTSSIILKDINFETDKSDLLQSSYKELDELVYYLKQNPSFKIEINGYTDNTGKANDNLKLSEERAKTVVNYLIQNGIEEKRTSYKGYGSENPILPNDTEIDKAKNRRVEFKLIKE